MVVILVTNGSWLSAKSIAGLKAAGISSVIISIDAASAARHEANRHLPGVCEKIRKANRIFLRHRIQTTASVTMSRLIDAYRDLPPFLRELGFDSVTFSYPLTTLSSSFLGHSDSTLVTYTPEEPIGSLFDFDDSQRVRDGCTRCMIDCYRDASVMQHVSVSLSDAIALAREGVWRAAVVPP